MATTPAATTPVDTAAQDPWANTRFVLNTNTKKIHLPDCRYASKIKDENRKETVGTAEITDKYEACKVCLPDFTLNN